MRSSRFFFVSAQAAYGAGFSRGFFIFFSDTDASRNDFFSVRRSESHQFSGTAFECERGVARRIGDELLLPFFAL